MNYYKKAKKYMDMVADNFGKFLYEYLNEE